MFKKTWIPGQARNDKINYCLKFGLWDLVLGNWDFDKINLAKN